MLHGGFRLSPPSPPGSRENGSKEPPCSIRVRSPLLKTLCVDTQDTLQREADKDAIFAKCISRFPPDFYIGVKQHRLDELFTPGVENGFAVWMKMVPARSTSHLAPTVCTSRRLQNAMACRTRIFASPGPGKPFRRTNAPFRLSSSRRSSFRCLLQMMSHQGLASFV